MHLRLSAQTSDTLQEGLSVRPHGAPQGFVGVENRAETERKNSQGSKTLANHTRVVDNRLLRESLFGTVIADDDCEVSTGISQYGGAVDASKVFYREGAPGASSILKALLLGNTVRVPRHLSLSWEYSHTGNH